MLLALREAILLHGWLFFLSVGASNERSHFLEGESKGGERFGLAKDFLRVLRAPGQSCTIYLVAHWAGEMGHNFCQFCCCTLYPKVHFPRRDSAQLDISGN